MEFFENDLSTLLNDIFNKDNFILDTIWMVIKIL